jgi:hypothetical protein
MDMHGWLELGYFVSGIVSAIVLLGGAIIGLRQLHLLKEDIEHMSQRAASEKALETIQSYLILMQDIAKYESEATAAHLSLYEGDVTDFSLNTDWSTSNLAARQDLGAIDIVNKLEYVAAMFTTSAADKDIGFRMIGASFCRFVKGNYDIISVCRHVNPPTLYCQDIVALYEEWSKRLTSDGHLQDAWRLRICVQAFLGRARH